MGHVDKDEPRRIVMINKMTIKIIIIFIELQENKILKLE